MEEKSGKIVPIVGVKDVTFSDSKKWRKKGGNQSQSFGVEKAYKSVPIVGVKKAYKSVPIVRQGERCNVSDSKITLSNCDEKWRKSDSSFLTTCLADKTNHQSKG